MKPTYSSLMFKINHLLILTPHKPLMTCLSEEKDSNFQNILKKEKPRLCLKNHSNLVHRNNLKKHKPKRMKKIKENKNQFRIKKNNP